MSKAHRGKGLKEVLQVGAVHVPYVGVLVSK